MTLRPKGGAGVSEANGVPTKVGCQAFNIQMKECPSILY